MLGAVGTLIARVHRKRHQAIRDRRASLILKKLEMGETVEFPLYLRAFATTGKLLQETDHHSFEARYRPVFDDMEEALAKAFEETAPMVALGLPGEHIGAGRVATTEESWRDIFVRLALNAKVLLLLPSARPGTLLRSVGSTREDCGPRPSCYASTGSQLGVEDGRIGRPVVSNTTRIGTGWFRYSGLYKVRHAFQHEWQWACNFVSIPGSEQN